MLAQSLCHSLLGPLNRTEPKSMSLVTTGLLLLWVNMPDVKRPTINTHYQYKTLSNVLEREPIGYSNKQGIHYNFLLDVSSLFQWSLLLVNFLITSQPLVLSAFFLSPLSLPSIRPSLPAGINHFPAAAWGEASHTSTSALWKENGHATTRVRRQAHPETGLQPRLQHVEMYECSKHSMNLWSHSCDTRFSFEIQVEPHTQDAEVRWWLNIK